MSKTMYCVAEVSTDVSMLSSYTQPILARQNTLAVFTTTDYILTNEHIASYCIPLFIVVYSMKLYKSIYFAARSRLSTGFPVFESGSEQWYA